MRHSLQIIQVVNQHFNDTLCEDNFVLPKVKSRYHGPPITRAIPFSKTEFTVAHHDAKYLYCTGFTPRDGGEGDDSSSIGGGGGRVVTTAQLQAAAVRASAADKMRRRSSGRGVSFGNARASPGNNEDAESMISDMTLNSILTENQQGFARENRRFSLYSSKKVEGTTVLTEEMLRINARKTMTSIYSDSIIESSITDPAVLLGYQVINWFVANQYSLSMLIFSFDVYLQIVMPYNKEIQAQFEKGKI